MIRLVNYHFFTPVALKNASIKFHKVVWFTLIFMGLSAISPSFAIDRAEETYFIGNFDIPVFEGLTIIEKESVEFDKPDGQISEYQAERVSSLADVFEFYKNSMPELGWTKTEETNQQLIFRRNKEQVTIAKETNEDGDSLVVFRITSSNE